MADSSPIDIEKIARNLEIAFEEADFDKQLSQVSHLDAVDKDGRTCLHWLVERKANAELKVCHFCTERHVRNC